jgi:tRNA nucleotidyltransferase/poly(A) polymerase
MTNIPPSYQGIQHVPDFDPKQLYSNELLFDALQRDFTINALYYDLRNGNIIDLVGGMYDLKEGILRTLVPAQNEFQYDPRTLLRAIRFKARFGFDLSDDVERAIKEQGNSLIMNISPSGVSKNLPDMFFGGYTRSSTKYLLQYNLFEFLLPDTASMYLNSFYQEYAMKVAYVVDWLYDEGCMGLPLLAMSALLWPAVEHYHKKGLCMEDAAGKVLDSQRKIMSMSDEEADFMYKALVINEINDEKSLIEHVDSIFGVPQFEDALGVLRLNYMKHPIRTFI